MNPWTIRRTKPLGTVPGHALPCLISNRDYHLTWLDVYADGVVDCWELLDLPLFRQKAATGWIATQPPIGACLSIFHLGTCTIAAAAWDHTVPELVAHVDATVTSLNPTRGPLVDLDGVATMPHPLYPHALTNKLGSSDRQFCRTVATGDLVLGTSIPLFVHTATGWTFSPGVVYADHVVQLAAGATVVPVEVLTTQLLTGAVVTSVPDGTWIQLPGLGRVQSAAGHWPVVASERIREIADEVAMLNGGMGTIRMCNEQYDQYQHDPTPAHKMQLQAAYEAVPRHLRRYCGDWDMRDRPIRQLLYGKDGE